MGEDLVDGAGPADEGEAVDGENDQAEVAEGGEGDQPPEIALHESEARAVKNADDGESDEQRRDGAGLSREESDVEAQHGVEAELAGDHHGQGDGSFVVGVGEPAVQREDGNLDGEGEEKRERDPEERAGGKDTAGGLVLEIGEVEGVGLRVEPENGDQQRRRGNEGEEEELERGVGAVFAAVHGDEDGHGDERELPEAVVEHQVERDEDAEHGGLLDEEERVEDLAASLDGVPTGDDADGREQADEDDEPEAEAVDADVVEDGGVFDPGNVVLKLEAGLAGDEVRGKMQREQEGDERGEQGDPVGQLGAVGQERDEDRAGERDQQDEGENGLVDTRHSQWPACPG